MLLLHEEAADVKSWPHIAVISGQRSFERESKASQRVQQRVARSQARGLSAPCALGPGAPALPQQQQLEGSPLAAGRLPAPPPSPAERSPPPAHQEAARVPPSPSFPAPGSHGGQSSLGRFRVVLVANGCLRLGHHAGRPLGPARCEFRALLGRGARAFPLSPRVIAPGLGPAADSAAHARHALQDCGSSDVTSFGVAGTAGYLVRLKGCRLRGYHSAERRAFHGAGTKAHAMPQSLPCPVTSPGTPCHPTLPCLRRHPSAATSSTTMRGGTCGVSFAWGGGAGNQLQAGLRHGPGRVA